MQQLPIHGRLGRPGPIRSGSSPSPLLDEDQLQILDGHAARQPRVTHHDVQLRLPQAGRVLLGQRGVGQVHGVFRHPAARLFVG